VRPKRLGSSIAALDPSLAAREQGVGIVQEQISTYAPESGAIRNGRTVGRLVVYIGMVVLIAAASLVAVNGRNGASSKLAQVLLPRSGAACTSPPNGFLWTLAVDNTQLRVCISQQGNINQIQYPDAASNHTQIAFEGYCLIDEESSARYKDFGPGSPVASSGFKPATMTVGPSSEDFNPISVTRTTTDNKFQLTQYIKILFQPRAIFVGMTVKNIDPANVTHHALALRFVAPALDGNATNDLYNAFGIGGDPTTGRTAQAYQNPGPGHSSLLFGATQSNGAAFTQSREEFVQFQGCSGTNEVPGSVQTGNRLLWAWDEGGVSLAPGQSGSVGKFVYRMA
jgi:hypothetical protein